MAGSLYKELTRRNVFKVVLGYIILGWAVLQVADILVPAFNLPDWTITFLVIIGLLGVPFVIFFAWAFEITPDGIKRDHDVNPEDSISHLTGHKIDYTVKGLLIVALGFFAFDKFVLDPSRDAELVQITTDSVNAQNEESAKAVFSDNSIAVLPFANRSNIEDDLYFTDGIHDDILTQLAKVKDMKVVSRTSVMKFRSTDKTIPEIGRELGVTTILEGGVQRAGKRIRINAQLIDVATDEHLWAETFDREMTIDNLFDIQSDITKHIVRAVKGQLNPEEASSLDNKMTKSLAAWEAYSQARLLLRSSGYNAEKYLATLPLAKEAVRLDPEFLPALLMYANIHGLLYWTNVDTSDERKKMARTALDKAIAIAPTSAEVLLAQGEYAYRFDKNYQSALDFQQQALQDNSSDAQILEAIALTQRRLGKWDDAAENLLLASKLAPDNQSIISATASTLSAMRDVKRLQLFLATVRARFPKDSDLGAIAADLAIWDEGNLAKAQKIFQKVTPNAGSEYVSTTLRLAWLEGDLSALLSALSNPEVLTYLNRYPGSEERARGLAYHEYGKKQLAAVEFNKLVDSLDVISHEQEPLYFALQLVNIATAKALLGNADDAIALAEQALGLFSQAIDKTDGVIIDRAVCYVLALVGQHDEALILLEKLLNTPNGFKRWHLYLDPRWDFFRDDERFNQLIKPLNI